MRSAFRRLSETLLADLEHGDRAEIEAALVDLRRRRITLDDDFSETRLHLDAALVRLERDVREVLNESDQSLRDMGSVRGAEPRP